MTPARVLVIGGTGLLGSAAALALREAGHEVTLASRRPPTDDALLAFVHRPVDLDDLTPGSAERLVAGFDAVLLAAGPDDRAPYPAPAEGYLHEHLVQPTALLAQAAARSRVRALVVLGSYFSAWVREHPGEGLEARHPYIAARVAQEAELRARGDRLAVVLLDVPYVFGSLLGRYPTWVDVVLDNAVGPLPLVAYPAGGAPATSVVQVGQAAAGAVARALRRGPGFEAFAVGERLLTWPEMFRELGAGAGRRLRLVPVPGVVAQRPARSLARAARRRGRHLGIDPARIIPDAVGRMMPLDLEPAREVLGYASVDLAAAVRETARVRARLMRAGGR